MAFEISSESTPDTFSTFFHDSLAIDDQQYFALAPTRPFQRAFSAHLNMEKNVSTFSTQNRGACLTLRKKINSRPVTTNIEILLQTFARLKSQLRQIVSPIISEQHNTARTQIVKTLIGHMLHSNRE